jgi:hypothetical protein
LSDGKWRRCPVRDLRRMRPNPAIRSNVAFGSPPTRPMSPVLSSVTLGCVGDGVFLQPRGAGRRQGVPWRLGRFQIASRGHTDHRHEATAVEGIALHHDARPAERGFRIRLMALPRFAVLCRWDTSSRNEHGVQRAAYRHGHGKRLSETDDEIGTTPRNACPLSEGGPHLRHLNRHVEMGMSDTENGRL